MANFQLPRFSLAVCVDSKGGIIKDGWSDVLKTILPELTVNSVVITEESMSHIIKYLPNQKNIIIISSTPNNQNREHQIATSLLLALQAGYERHLQVFIIAFELYQSLLKDYLYLCDQAHIINLEKDCNSGIFFPINLVYPTSSDKYTYIIWKNDLITHQEIRYLDLLQNILKTSKDVKEDRTGVGTYSIFGANLEFDVSNGILPVITTKKINIDHVVKELLWMISGSTDVKKLEAQGVPIWTANSTREFLDNRGLTNLREGDIGPSYGHQWRRWGANYHGCDKINPKEGCDQLTNLINNLKQDPFSRRHVVSAWNVEDLNGMALPPCHLLMQFNVTQINGNKHLDLQVYLRSSDTFLGLPYNITFYALMLHIISYLTGYSAHKLRLVTGDTHIYQNHLNCVKQQLERTPLPFPTISFMEPFSNIDELSLKNIKINNYLSYPALRAPMAI